MGIDFAAQWVKEGLGDVGDVNCGVEIGKGR